MRQLGMSNKQQENTKIAAATAAIVNAICKLYQVARLDWLLTYVLCIREYFSGMQITGDLPFKFPQHQEQVVN
jgi:hypothetical protein